MKPQTDNSNIVVYSDLIYAADKEYKEHFIAGFEHVYHNGVLFGVNWQKEQLQPLIDSHAELLGLLKSAKCFIPFVGYNHFMNPVESAIEKANKLIKP